jgi:signal transduction histidine kinase
MADNVVQWPGPQERDEPTSGAERAPDPPGWLRLEEALADSPEHLRKPVRDLTAALFRQPAGESPEPKPDWYTDLDLPDAWRAAEILRRALLQARRTSPDELTDLHLRLDRMLAAIALDELEQAADAQHRWLEGVSHDIRSPLNSILFLADALRTELSGPLNEVQSHQLGVLYTAAVTLVKLANDLIDFARMGERETIRVVRTSFSVESVLVDVRGLLGPLVAHRKVQLRTDVSTEGLRSGDPQLLSRVLLNLVSNAVEAADEGGNVSLELSETEDCGLVIRVSDDRVGTDVSRLRRLLAATEGEVPGETRGWTRGLGLTISACLVRAAGGSICVDGLPGEGTVFSLELPFPRL